MAFTGNSLAHGKGFHAFNLFAALASLLSERFVGKVHDCAIAWFEYMKMASMFFFVSLPAVKHETTSRMNGQDHHQPC